MGRAKLARAELISRLEVLFCAKGYAGTSLADITAATGLGKGSLYHAFPGGKDEMAKVVLTEASARMESRILRPLEAAGDAARAIAAMFEAAHAHYEGGRRICLPAAFALHDTDERFSDEIRSLFRRWRKALAGCLVRGGISQAHAARLSEETLAVIEGGLILARACDDPALFEAGLKRQYARLSALLDARRRRGGMTGQE